MATLLDEKQQEKNNLSELTMDYDKTNLSNSNINKAKKEFLLNSCNDYSELRQSYLNTPLKNISINFGFPNTMNTYKYKNPFPLTEVPLFEQRNVFYYDKDFQLFKNKSVSKYGEKQNKSNGSLSQHSKYNRILSPQHKIITSIKKKKYLDEKEVEDIKNETNKKGKNGKEEKDVYELEVINQVLLDEDDSEGKNKKNGLRQLENEWGEIEQEIFENEKDKKNNLLNSIYVEIEKENGDKQLKVVEITKEEKTKKEPCIKIKYTVEDKICLGGESLRDERNSDYDRETKDSAVKSTNYKTYTNSTSNINYSTSSIKKHDYSTLKKENVSEILLKESKSTHNIFSSSDKDNEKIYSSGSSIPSTKKYKKYSNYKQDFNLPKEKRQIEPIKYNFGKEEEISPIRKVNEIEEKNIKLMDIINDEKEEEDVKPNKSIEIEEKYFIKKEEKAPKNADVKEKERDIKTFEKNRFKKNFFEENKEKIQQEEKEETVKEPVKVEKKEITIKVEKEIIERVPIKDKKEENKGFVSRFRVKDKDKEEKEKEMIIDRNKILNEKKIQEIEIEKVKDKKFKKIDINQQMKLRKNMKIKKD